MRRRYIDEDVDPLFFDAERRNLGKCGRLDPADAALERSLTAPVVDHHFRARPDRNRVRAQHVDDDFEVERITDLQDRAPG